MKGVTKTAKKANGLSRKCAICPVSKTCTSIIQRVCSDAFIEGYKKGAKWVEKQNQNVQLKVERSIMETKTFKQKRLELIKDAHDSVVKSLAKTKGKCFIPLDENHVLKEHFKGYRHIELSIIEGKIHCNFHYSLNYSLLLDISKDTYLICLADYLNNK